MTGAVFGEGGVWLSVAGAALRDILGDSRSAKCCILQYKIVAKIARGRSPKRRVRDDNFISDYRRISSDIVGYRRISSDYPRIVFILAEALEALSPEIFHFKIMWQAQYLVRLEGDFTCSAHWKWRSISDADRWWHSFCVAGAVFGEGGVWLFVAGAALRDILGDSRSAKCCILQYKIFSKMGRVRSPKRRARDDDFILGLCSECVRNVVESSFYWRRHFREFLAEILNSEFRGRRSTLWVWRVTLLAPRIGNDGSYVTRIKREIHFAWQVQYLVRLEGDFACSAHWKWRFICDADHWWHWFCVAGAVFGEVGGWLLVAGAAHRDILGDSRSAKCCILQYKIVSKMGRVRSPKRRVRDDNFMLGLCSDYRRIVFIWAEALQALLPEIYNFKISWQAQYLVRLEGDFTCSAHWKWRFICDADHSWDSFCVAGATFGEAGGCLLWSTGVVRCSTGVELCSTE